MMNSGTRNACAILLLFTLGLVSGQTSAPADPCATAVGQFVNECLQPASVSTPNFLWFASNASSPSSQVPTDPAGFKTLICSVVKDVMPCMITRIRPTVNTTCKANPQLLSRIQQYLMNYEMKCVNPCIITLQQDFAKCFTSNGLTPDLLISNKTAGGKFLGASQAEANAVCAKKDAILGCLKPIHDACPDAKDVLKSVGFSLTTYEMALGLLCPRLADYLAALPCFSQPQPAVKACLDNEMPQVQKIAEESRVQRWTEDKVVAASCGITKDKLVCDLAAWDASTLASCTPQVKAFRKEMECTLLPQTCTDTQKGLYWGVCTTPNTQTDPAPPTTTPAMTSPETPLMVSQGQTAGLDASGTSIVLNGSNAKTAVAACLGVLVFSLFGF